MSDGHVLESVWKVGSVPFEEWIGEILCPFCMGEWEGSTKPNSVIVFRCGGCGARVELTNPLEVMRYVEAEDRKAGRMRE